MKFEFSRRFLLGSAVAGALTSCGGLESPEGWAQKPIDGVAPVPAVAEKPAEVSAPEEEDSSSTGLSGWWNQNKKEEKVAEVKPAEARAAEPKPQAAEPKKPSFWESIKGDGSDADSEDQKVAKTKVKETPAAAVQKTAPAPQRNGDYATATKVGAIDGYVNSPYNNRWVNVKGVPSGSLVADPRFPLEEKKFFRVP